MPSAKYNPGLAVTNLDVLFQKARYTDADLPVNWDTRKPKYTYIEFILYSHYKGFAKKNCTRVKFEYSASIFI